MTDTENKENKEDKENNENINIIRSISPVNQIFSCGICLEVKKIIIFFVYFFNTNYFF